MLLWLRQRLPKKNLFLFKLSILSAVTHFILCFGFFFMYKEYHHSLLLQVHAKHNPDDVKVRLLPLSAKKPRVRVAKRAIGIAKKKVAKKTVVKKKTMQLAQVAKPKPVKVTSKVEPKQIAKKVEKKTTPKEDLKPKPVEKKEIKPVEKKQEVKAEPVKESPKVEPKKVESSKQIKEEIKIDPVEEVEENVRYVTHKELRGIELENAVQAAVQEVWSPPLGVDQEVVSEVLVTVGWDGKLAESKMLKLSDIVIYDVAVQEALEDIKFPRQIWGKEIKIAFRP